MKHWWINISGRIANVTVHEQTGNLVWHREHDNGGHFAAMEVPKDFVQDMEDFVKEVWPKAKEAKM